MKTIFSLWSCVLNDFLFNFYWLSHIRMTCIFFLILIPISCHEFSNLSRPALCSLRKVGLNKGKGVWLTPKQVAFDVLVWEKNDPSIDISDTANSCPGK